MSVEASDSGELPTNIMILPLGDWNTQFYGPMQVTDEHLSQIVANFKAGVRKAVPVDVDHDGGKAAGWIKALDAGSDGLHASVDWTPYGKGLLENKEYKMFSPEWSFDYVDPEHGSRHGAVLIAGSLTNRPLFKELPILMASDGSGKQGLTKENQIMILLGSDINSPDNMNKEEILKKAVADRTPEEVEFLSKVTDFTDEEKTQLETEKVDAQKAEDEAKAKAEEEAKAKEEADAKAKAEAEEKAKAEEEAKKANEGKTVTISASEHAELMEIKKANDKAQAELRRLATEKEMKAFMANDKGGKLLPKAFEGTTLVDMVLTFSEDQKAKFISFVQSLPDVKIAGEAGDGDSSLLTAKEQITKLVSDKVKASEGKITKAQAMKDVLSENEALAKQYQEELK